MGQEGNQTAVATDISLQKTSYMKLDMLEHIYEMLRESRLLHGGRGGFGEWLGWEKVNLVHSIFCKKILTIFRSKTIGGVRGSLEMKELKDKD